MGEWGCPGEGKEQLLTHSQGVVGVRLGVSAMRCLMEDTLLFLFLIFGSSLPLLSRLFDFYGERT